MKTQEEIEQLAELYTNKIVEVAYHNFPLVHTKETVSKVITALLKEYTTQCQKDMADRKYTEEAMIDAFIGGYKQGLEDKATRPLTEDDAWPKYPTRAQQVREQGWNFIIREFHLATQQVPKGAPPLIFECWLVENYNPPTKKQNNE